ncbi:hypothetical protein C0J52_17162 [Blattella germanica]|nr:hypothetical protein C0J52_17162 [Blattella germanica]
MSKANDTEDDSECSQLYLQLIIDKLPATSIITSPETTLPSETSPSSNTPETSESPTPSAITTSEGISSVSSPAQPNLEIVTWLTECHHLLPKHKHSPEEIQRIVKEILLRKTNDTEDDNYCNPLYLQLIIDKLPATSITTSPETTMASESSPSSTTVETPESPSSYAITTSEGSSSITTSEQPNLEIIITWLKDCHYLKPNETQDQKEIQRIVQEILHGTRTSDVIATGVNNNCSAIELLLLIKELPPTPLTTTILPSLSSTEYTSTTTTKTSKIELLLLCGYITNAEAEGVTDETAFYNQILQEVAKGLRKQDPNSPAFCKVESKTATTTPTSTSEIESSYLTTISETSESSQLTTITEFSESSMTTAFTIISTTTPHLEVIVKWLKKCQYLKPNEKHSPKEIQRIVKEILKSKANDTEGYSDCSPLHLQLIIEKLPATSIITSPETTLPSESSPSSNTGETSESQTSSAITISEGISSIPTTAPPQLQIILTWLKSCHYVQPNETQASMEIERIVQEILKGTRTSDLVANGVSNNCSPLELLLLIEKLPSTSTNITTTPSVGSTEYASTPSTQSSKIALLLLCGYITPSEAEGVRDVKAFENQILKEVFEGFRKQAPNSPAYCNVSSITTTGTPSTTSVTESSSVKFSSETSFVTETSPTTNSLPNIVSKSIDYPTIKDIVTSVVPDTTKLNDVDEIYKILMKCNYINATEYEFRDNQDISFISEVINKYANLTTVDADCKVENLKKRLLMIDECVDFVPPITNECDNIPSIDSLVFNSGHFESDSEVVCHLDPTFSSSSPCNHGKRRRISTTHQGVADKSSLMLSEGLTTTDRPRHRNPYYRCH